MYSPRKSPREKVRTHWKNLALAMGAMTMSCDSGKGFDVVDPMPPPAVCSAGSEEVNAVVEVDGDNNWVLTLMSTNPELIFSNSVAAEKGTVLSSKLETDTTFIVVLAPETALLDVFLRCSDGSQTVLKVTVSESGGVVSAVIESSDTGS